jgi:hypothetical protein
VNGAERQDAFDLLEKAMLLMPEGEPFDLTDLELTPAETAIMKSVVSRVRSACDIVNRALAEAWQINYPNVDSVEIGDDLYWLGPAKGKRYTEGGAIALGEWIEDQDDPARAFANTVSASGVKVSGLPDDVRAEVLDEEPRNDEPRIQTMPAQMTKGKGGR